MLLVYAWQNSRTIPTVEMLRGGSFSFPPEPLLVKLLTLLVELLIYDMCFSK